MIWKLWGNSEEAQSYAIFKLHQRCNWKFNASKKISNCCSICASTRMTTLTVFVLGFQNHWFFSPAFCHFSPSHVNFSSNPHNFSPNFLSYPFSLIRHTVETPFLAVWPHPACNPPPPPPTQPIAAPRGARTRAHECVRRKGEGRRRPFNLHGRSPHAVCNLPNLPIEIAIFPISR